MATAHWNSQGTVYSRPAWTVRIQKLQTDNRDPAHFQPWPPPHILFLPLCAQSYFQALHDTGCRPYSVHLTSKKTQLPNIVTAQLPPS